MAQGWERGRWGGWVRPGARERLKRVGRYLFGIRCKLEEVGEKEGRIERLEKD